MSGGQTIGAGGLDVWTGGHTVITNGIRILGGGLYGYDGLSVITTGLTVYDGGTSIQTNVSNVSPGMWAINTYYNVTAGDPGGGTVVHVSLVDRTIPWHGSVLPRLGRY